MGLVSDLSRDISQNRAHYLAQLTLLIDFHSEDLIRWLGGAYTHNYIPLALIRQAVDAICSIH